MHEPMLLASRQVTLLDESFPLVRIVLYAVRHEVRIVVGHGGHEPYNASVYVLATSVEDTLTAFLIDLEGAIA
jgi:hypothetical protein